MRCCAARPRGDVHRVCRPAGREQCRLRPGRSVYSAIEVDGRVQVQGTIVPLPDDPWPYQHPQSSAGTSEPVTVPLPLIPYHDWANRGASTMRVWIPTV